MYKLLKPVVFLSRPEWAHNAVIKILRYDISQWLLKAICKPEKYNKPTELWGLKFKNPIGLAAGFDKNAEVIEGLASLGFGFIEIGTVTPRPQPGNPKPRIFRLSKDQAIINRMGFNNNGVQQIKENIKQIRKKDIIIGINLGKNKDTPNEQAASDYLHSFKELFDYGDYFVINVSSPNTPNLRDLQKKEMLSEILKTLQDFNMIQDKPKPLLLKIAPDLSYKQIDDILEEIYIHKLSGIIATNTTITRPENLRSNKRKIQQTGGLSGKPLKQKSTEIIKYIHKTTQGKLPIIGVGGIMDFADMQEKLEAGASLIQIYTGLIYNGPCFVKKLKKEYCENYC